MLVSANLYFPSLVIRIAFEMEPKQLMEVKTLNLFCSFFICKTCFLATAWNWLDWKGLILAKFTLKTIDCLILAFDI